ncbi:MAG: hypothetical protein ACJ74E_12110 [Actinomycetes bacterium]
MKPEGRHATVHKIAVIDRSFHFVQDLAQGQAHSLEMRLQRLKVVLRQRRQKQILNGEFGTRRHARSSAD